MGNDLAPLLPEAWPQLVLAALLWLLPLTIGVVATVIAILRHRKNGIERPPAQVAATHPASIESRLTEIDQLLAAGRIDHDEHAAMRSRALDLH